MRDYFCVFNILGEQVTVLYLAKNHYAPQVMKSPNTACTRTVGTSPAPADTDKSDQPGDGHQPS